jgi:hypothetical protein
MDPGYLQRFIRYKPTLTQKNTYLSCAYALRHQRPSEFSSELKVSATQKWTMSDENVGETKRYLIPEPNGRGRIPRATRECFKGT